MIIQGGIVLERTDDRADDAYDDWRQRQLDKEMFDVPLANPKGDCDGGIQESEG